MNELEFILNDNGDCLKKNCGEGFIFDSTTGCQPCPKFCKQCSRLNTLEIVCDICVEGNIKKILYNFY